MHSRFMVLLMVFLGPFSTLFLIAGRESKYMFCLFFCRAGEVLLLLHYGFCYRIMESICFQA